MIFLCSKFVAHPNIQQLLSTMWYEGLPGFRRKPLLEKCWEIVKVIWLFPFYCLLYMFLPETQTGRLMRKPFMKFLIHAASYLFFLLILILVSQRADVVAIQLLGTESMRAKAEESLLRQRGNGPSFLEYVVIIYVLGFIWEEALEMYKEGLHKYLRNMWNFIDCTRNFMYILTFALRVVAYVQQKREIALDPATAYIPRERWDAFDPQLVAEGLFAAANVLSALKLVHLFSINPHLGPLQISLGRMIIDIVKFFFIYTLVLFAFACGINQLMWYFAELERKKCYSLPGEMPDWMNNADSCTKWRTFGNLFESSQSLFWASFGGVGIDSFELSGIKSYTRFFGLLMFGSYSVINVIVLLNLLIAMMSNSYSLIEEHSDSEWKFARTKLWMSYFEDSATLPPPFNILPNLKFILKACRLRNKDKLCKKSSKGQSKERGANEDYLHCAVMRALVWRYVSVMHRHADEDPVTEDHINEVKGEVSAAKCEILEVLQRNGMDVTSADRKEKTILGRKMKMWERRLMKDFHVAPVTPSEELDSVLSEKPPVTEKEQPLARFQRVARSSVSKSANANEMWGQVVESASIASQIGRSSSRNSWTKRQNLQRAMDEAKRLVSKSPRNCRETVPSPVPEDDSTLIDLLRDFEKEIGPRTPMRDQQQKDASSQGNEGSDDMNHRIYLSVQNLAEATGECDDKTASRRSEKEIRRRSLGAPETNKDAVDQGQGQGQCNSQGQCRAIPERPTSPSPSPTPSSKPNVQFSVSVIDPTPSPKRHISRTQLEDPHDSSNPSLKSNLLPPKVIKKKGSAGGCPEGDKNIERIHRPRSPKNIQAPLPPSLIPRPGQPSSPDVRLTPPTHPSPYPLELDVKNQATRPSAPLNASTEYLIPRSSPSPEPLKPGKRIVDVSTIERPAKASWM